MKIGVCCFDDTKDPEGGWASVNGGDAVWVNGPGDLNSNVFWVTNLPFPTHKKLNLGAAGNIFDSQYFRTQLPNIGVEMALDDDPKALSEFSSAIFQNVADLGEDHLGIDMSNPGYRYHKMLSYSLIPEDARAYPKGPNSADILEAISHSTQANQAMSGVKRPPGSRPVSLSFPRHAYGKWIMNLPYPKAEKWTVVRQRENSSKFGTEDGKLLRNTSAVLNRLNELGSKNALFLRVTVHSMDRFYKRFASFGAGEKHIRRWATLPEVIELSRYAKISISGGYMCPLREDPLVANDMFGEGDIAYSRGLLIENVWAALSCPITVQSGPRQTTIGAYMRAYDRIACGRAAAQLASGGLVVGSYSMGRVIVFIRPGEEVRAAEKALDIGLLPPMSYLNEES